MHAHSRFHSASLCFLWPIVLLCFPRVFHFTVVSTAKFRSSVIRFPQFVSCLPFQTWPAQHDPWPLKVPMASEALNTRLSSAFYSPFTRSILVSFWVYAFFLFKIHCGQTFTHFLRVLWVLYTVVLSLVIVTFDVDDGNRVKTARIFL